MGRIVVSGASGDLGRRITAELWKQVDPADLILTTRTPDGLADRAAAGARVCRADYNDPPALEHAYRGGDILMLISGLAVTRRVPEHRNAIEAAKAAGIRHIVYTSVIGIHPANPTLSAGDHRATEALLRDSGLGHTILRNGTYAEMFPENVGPIALATGKWFQLEGEGKMAPVAKDDIARCAARILVDPRPHDGAVYELTGPELFSFREMAQLVSEIHGVPIEYVPVSAEERLAMFDAIGIPRSFREGMEPHPQFHLWASDEMLSAEQGFSAGFQEILTGHVRMITGRDPMSLRSVIERARAAELR